MINHASIFKSSTRLFTLIITLIVTCNTQSFAAESNMTDSKQSVGLVLSGGGAKGIAHVGVIKALEENDIPIDYVTGTSMGAIVGSLYSCGWSPEKMLKFFTAPDFLNWSQGVISKNYIYYAAEPIPSPKWVGINLNLKDEDGIGNNILPTNLISPLPMNIEFLKLYSPYSAQCKENFNNLFVPFRCVTSDVYHKHKIVLSKGSLGDAVRASMSFPLVFKPIKMDGVLVYDGGIYDNFPVDVMQKDFNPDFIIGVSVSSPDKKPQAGNVYSQLEDMIIQNNDYSVPSKNGIKIQVPVLDFGVLDFAQASTIYEIGYKTGLAMVDSIKKRVHSREPLSDVTSRREKFASATPQIEFDKIEVTGLPDKGQAKYLVYLFNQGKKHTITMDETVNAYYQAVTDGTLSDLLPQAELGKNGKNNTLLLEATGKKPWGFGVGGWITSSTNSMLYLNVNYHTLSYNMFDFGLSGWIGQTYLAGMLNAKFRVQTENPSFIKFEGVMSKQRFYDSQLLFYENSSPTFITENDNFLRFSYEWALGHSGKGYASLAYGYMSDSYYPTNVTNYAETSKDKTQYHIGALKAGVEFNTLNSLMFASEGEKWGANVLMSYESARYTPEGDKALRTGFNGRPRASLEGYWKHYYQIHKNIVLGASASALGTLQQMKLNYTAALVHAPAFAPTPSTENYFNEAFRSDNYVAAGLIPIWMPIQRMQLRGDFYVYSPIRNMVREGMKAKYDGWFRKAEFIGEVAAVYNFPFASLSVYCNYLSYPSKNWNVGINFGLLFGAPKLLR